MYLSVEICQDYHGYGFVFAIFWGFLLVGDTSDKLILLGYGC